MELVNKIKTELKKIRNRKQARKEHEGIEELYFLNFESELQERLKYKKSLLRNELMEVLNIDKNDIVSIINLNNLIEQRRNENQIVDFFYNKIN